MTQDEALAMLTAWLEPAKAAVAAKNVAAGEQIAVQAVWLRFEPERPTTRALAVAYARLAEVMCDLVRPEASVGLFSCAANAFILAPDTTIDDRFGVLHNLALAQLHAKEGGESNETLNALAQLAALNTEPIAAATAAALMWHVKQCREIKAYAAMVAFQAQVLRFMLQDDFADAQLVAWLGDHLIGLREGGRQDLVLTDIERVEAALRPREAVMPLTLGLCALHRAYLRAAQEDWPAAAELADRAGAARGLADAERTELLAMSARMWFKAGDFNRSADRARRALRRRVGLAE